jgi:hypothetical protein
MRVTCASLSLSPRSSFHGGLVTTGCAIMLVAPNVVAIQFHFPYVAVANHDRDFFSIFFWGKPGSYDYNSQQLQTLIS